MSPTNAAVRVGTVVVVGAAVVVVVVVVVDGVVLVEGDTHRALYPIGSIGIGIDFAQISWLVDLEARRNPSPAD